MSTAASTEPPLPGPSTTLSVLQAPLWWSGPGGGGDILQVVGSLALSSVTAFTHHRVPEMAFDPETFLDITPCPLGTRSGAVAEKHRRHAENKNEAAGRRT